jgi:hypothetical protein
MLNIKIRVIIIYEITGHFIPIKIKIWTLKLNHKKFINIIYIYIYYFSSIDRNAFQNIRFLEFIYL